MAKPEQSDHENTDQYTNSLEKDQVVQTGQAGNVTFKRLRKNDLKSVPVLVQALDNQWLPRTLLAQAQEKGKVTGKIDSELRKAVRAEYIRSLINGQQLIVNRAYLYNNPAISQDYIHEQSLEREAFREVQEINSPKLPLTRDR
jgi:hypothetical protein